jgi:LysM repeat protein
LNKKNTSRKGNNFLVILLLMALAIIATFAIAITSTKRDPTLMVEAELRNHPIINPNARDSTASLIVQENPKEELPVATPEPAKEEIKPAPVADTAAKPKTETAPVVAETTPTKAPVGGGTNYEHMIASGDNLSTLSRRYHVLIAKLREANNMKNDVMQAGKKLIIPVTAIHTVANGETIGALASKYNVGAEYIKKANKLNSDGLQSGSQLVIPLP